MRPQITNDPEPEQRFVTEKVVRGCGRIATDDEFGGNINQAERPGQSPLIDTRRRRSVAAFFSGCMDLSPRLNDDVVSCFLFKGAVGCIYCYLVAYLLAGSRPSCCIIES